MNEVIDELPMTLQEAADFLNLSRWTLYHKTSLGEISFYKPGGRKLVFFKSDLMAYLRQNRSTATFELARKASGGR